MYLRKINCILGKVKTNWVSYSIDNRQAISDASKISRLDLLARKIQILLQTIKDVEKTIDPN